MEFMKRKSNDTVKFVEKLFVLRPLCIPWFPTHFGRWNYQRTPL